MCVHTDDFERMKNRMTKDNQPNINSDSAERLAAIDDSTYAALLGATALSDRSDLLVEQAEQLLADAKTMATNNKS